MCISLLWVKVWCFIVAFRSDSGTIQAPCEGCGTLSETIYSINQLQMLVSVNSSTVVDISSTFLVTDSLSSSVSTLSNSSSQYPSATSPSTQELITETQALLSTNFSSDSTPVPTHISSDAFTPVLTSNSTSSVAKTTAIVSSDASISNVTSASTSEPFPTSSPTTALILNTSSAYDSYWVKTVIQVTNLSVDISSSSFITTMEYRLATVYSLAMQTEAGIFTTGRRRRRAVTYENATIQVTNTTRESTSPTNVDLIYYLVEYEVINATFTSAQTTCSLMDLIQLQQVTLLLGYVVVTQCDVYIPPPPSYLWVIGVVIGGLFGLVLLVWFILFCYFKCTRPPPRRYVKRSPGGATSNHNNRVTALTDFEQQVAENDFADIVLENNVTNNQPSSADKYISDEAANNQPVSKRKKKKRRQTREAVDTPVVVNNETVQVLEGSLPSSDVHFAGYEERHGSVSGDSNDGVESSTDSLPPVHIPMYLDRRRPVIASWDPYIAGDMATHILNDFNPSPYATAVSESNDSGTELSITDSPVNASGRSKVIDNQPHHRVTSPETVTRQTQRQPSTALRSRDMETNQSDSIERVGVRPMSIADLIKYEHEQLFTPVTKPPI